MRLYKLCKAMNNKCGTLCERMKFLMEPLQKLEAHVKDGARVSVAPASLKDIIF